MKVSASLEPVFEYIDSHQDRHIKRIEDLVKVPSIAAENDADTKRCARLVESILKEIGCKKTKILKTKGQPVVYGNLDAGKEKTLLVYLMYDVKQVSGETWTLIKDPFQPKLMPLKPCKKVIVGRGTYNSKGPMIALINAIESIKKSSELPVNLKFVAEGEEELGSTNLKEALEQNIELFKDCEACIDPSAGQDISGEVSLYLGNKGSIEIELECSSKYWKRGPKRELHSSMSAIVDSPVWRLVHALASMTDPKNPARILIKGYYDNVLSPSHEERRMIKQLAEDFDEESFRRENEVESFMQGLHGEKLLEKLMFSTTLNIQGIYAGYTGPLFKTVLPEKAIAKIEARLVRNQAADEFSKKVRAHLDSNGYRDIMIHEYQGSDTADDWSKTDPNSGLVKAVVMTYEKYGHHPNIYPTAPWSMPGHLFTKSPLSIPLLSIGLGYGARAHAPDEYYVIEGNRKVEGLAGVEKFFVSCLFSTAKMKRLD